MSPEYTVIVEPWTHAQLEDMAYDLDIEEMPDERYDYYLTFKDEAFVDHVEKYLPKRGIRSAITIGKTFHECGIGFESHFAAKQAADLNVADLLQRLERVGHPWGVDFT